MKALLMFLFLPYLIAFGAGFLCACLMPPLCWWLDRWQKRNPPPGPKRGVVAPNRNAYVRGQDIARAISRMGGEVH